MTAPEVEQIKADLIQICRRLRAKNLVNATHGNVSARYQDNMIITPTGCDLETVTASDLVTLNIKTGLTVGKGEPSKEYEMHLLIYQIRPDISAVVHAHSPMSVAVGCLPHNDCDNIVPAYTLAFALFTKQLPMIGYFKAGSSELAQAAASKIKICNAVLLAHHGLITTADSLIKAYYRLEEIEENCAIALKIGLQGNAYLDPKKL